MNILKQFLSQNSHWQINKTFARAFGIDATILMTDLFDKWIYHESPEWFFNTADKIERDTTLSRYKQSKAMAILEENGFIEKKLMGAPAKLHFKILENKILSFFKTGLKETSKQDLKILENSYSKNKEDKNKEDKNKSINNVGQQSFPTCSNKKNDLESDSLKDQKEKKSSPPPQKKEKPSPAAEVVEIIEYLNDAAGKNFDPAANHSKHIRGRLKDGATVKEMKEVIDLKTPEWIDDDDMHKYIRPQTFFNKTNYEEYRRQWGLMGKKVEATERLKLLVNDFADQNKLFMTWDAYEVKALQEIARKLKELMKKENQDMSMDNFEVIFNQVLEKLDDYQLEHFSMKLINSKLNSILNAKQGNKKSEWARLVASFD